MKQISMNMRRKKLSDRIAAWVRGLVWAAMVLGCAWAGAQSYLVVPPSGHYKIASMSGAAAQGEAAQNNDTAAAKDDLFNGTEVFAKNATHVTEISMDPDSLGLVGGPDQHKAHNMVLNVVRSYEYDKPGMYNMADVEAFRNKLNTGDWHCSVHERDLKTGESTDVCSKHRTDGLREQAIMTVEPKELTFIHRIWRGNGPGSSDLGFFPMMRGIGPMTMMAMTDPEAFAAMEMGMRGMMIHVQPNVMLSLRSLDNLKVLNSVKVHPFNEEQMKEFNEKFKNLKPLDERQMRDLFKLKGLEVAPFPPEAPAGAEAPQPATAPGLPAPPAPPQPK